MKNVFSRLIAIILAISVCMPTFVFCPSALAASDIVTDLVSLQEWVDVFSFYSDFGTSSFTLGELRGAVLPSQLTQLASFYNIRADEGGCFSDSVLYRSALNMGWIDSFATRIFGGRPSFEIASDPLCDGVARIREQRTNRWLVNSDGTFPYCSWDAYQAELRGEYESSGSSSSKPFDGRWRLTNDITSSKKVVQKSYADMDATRADLANQYPNSYIALSSLEINGKKYTVIRRLEEGSGIRDWVWCSADGLPFVYVDPSTQGAAQNWNYTEIQETTDNIYGDTQAIKDGVDKLIEMTDENGNTVIYVPVQVGPNEWSFIKLDVDQITIDMSDNGVNYYIDSHDVTYDVENNYYVYNYYTYNFYYTYNNTYITYIGSTAEYQPKEWALYYELPDGRSSADLTEEDIAGLSFQFQDMVNYKRSATDTSLRALYHFDANVEDSSYWSTQGSFTWNKGASITYMDANAFNGALYLDEQEHQFTITLPSSIGSQDFTLQWRYYQNSATTTDHNENYVSVGGVKLLGWSEHSLYSLAITKLSTALSVGTWQELALVREKGTLYMYHNGVRVASASVPTVLTDKIVFYFGAGSRAYSMMDELRFVNFAITQGGASYTPTSVPYDTNNVLVLPDGAFPIAEEHWEWDKAISPYLSFDFTDGTFVPAQVVNNKRSGFGRFQSPYLGPMSNYSFYVHNSSISGFHSSGDSFLTLDGFVNIHASGIPGWYRIDDGYEDFFATTDAPTFFYKFSQSNLNGVYTFDFVLLDGTVHTWTVSLPNTVADMANPLIASKNFGTFTVNISDFGNYGRGFYFTGSVDLVYMDVVKGDRGNTNHKFVSAVFSSDELQPNTAAIQSTIPVNGYTVGGVRPTFPKRGDVWMYVQSSRIAGVYIYNGQAWEETNARYWTGQRWIPIYAFDLVTLADMWDVGSSSGEDVLPSITSEYGFWNWWKAQWLEFRSWLANNLGSGGISVVFPSPSECEHTYVQYIMAEPSCTQKGTALYTCSQCGDSYTEVLDASGHDWLLVDSIPDELDEETEEVITSGYDLYRCSVCGEEYRDYGQEGPPDTLGDSTLTELIQKLFEALGNLVGSLVDWVLDLGKEAMEGFGSLGEFFKEKAEEVQGFGGEYVGFLGVFFEVIPTEIRTCIALALLLFGLRLFVRKVIL